MNDCLFCRIVAGEIPANKVYEDNECLAFRDINPQAPTHVLIVPKRHVATTDDLVEGDRPVMGHLTFVASRIAREEGIAEDGYRLVLNCNAGAGQTVFHVHMHLLGGRGFGWPPG